MSIFSYFKGVYLLLKGMTWSQWTSDVALGLALCFRVWFSEKNKMAYSCSHLPIPVLWDLLQTRQKSSRERWTADMAVSACFPQEPPFLFAWCRHTFITEMPISKVLSLGQDLITALKNVGTPSSLTSHSYSTFSVSIRLYQCQEQWANFYMTARNSSSSSW